MINAPTRLCDGCTTRDETIAAQAKTINLLGEAISDLAEALERIGHDRPECRVQIDGARGMVEAVRRETA